MGKFSQHFRLLLLTAALVLHGICAWAAPFNVSGTVTDETGEPLIGVSVKAEKSNTGVSTDFNGQFSIVMQAPGTLEFSYVGMEAQKKKVSGATKLDIVLKENTNALDDVVVVGYGTQKKVNLTGAVQSVNSNQILRANTSNGANVLVGIVPGVYGAQGSGAPGGDAASLQIRGVGSINSSTSPLVLIDGVEGDMNRIDLANVESISVLKDAASASIYGSRASNGVILVTTKRGSQGKPKVSFNGYVGWSMPTEMPDPVNAVEYLQAIDIANVNAGIGEQNTELINKYLTEGANLSGRYDTNWKDLIMKKHAMSQNYSVGVSGGTDFLSIYAGAGYYEQEGMVPNNEFKRYNLRVNTDMKINSWVRIGVDAAVRQAEVRNPIGGANELIGYALTLLPTFGAYDLNVETGELNWGYGNGVGNNPIAAINAGGYSKSWAPEYNAKGNIVITPVKGLTIQGSWNWKRNDSRTYTFANQYSQYEGGVLKKPYDVKKVAVRENRSSADYVQYNAMATYENTFGKNYIKAMVGFQSEDYNTHSLEGYRNTFNYDGYEDLVNGDAATATNSTYRTTYAMLSYIFRINYAFNDRYLLEVNGRYDGTSRYKADKRWGFFPSVSAGWRISEESFLKETQTVLNNLKLRASYGELGNQPSNSNFPFASVVTAGPAYGYYFDETFVTGAAQAALSNAAIGWEKSQQVDVGIDFGLFNNRLSGTFDWYYRRVTDMLQTFPLPGFLAMSAPMKNAGDMENRGWELSLEWNDRIADFNYYARFNLSDVRNKVTKLYGANYTSGNRWTLQGEAYSQFAGYVADGYFQSYDEINATNPDGSYVHAVYGERSLVQPGWIKYKDLNGDGVINGDDRTLIGDPRPHFEFGLTLGGEWRGIDLSILFQGIGQRDVAYTGGGARPLVGGSTIYRHQLGNTWTEDNPNADYPLLLNDPNASLSNNMFSSFWVRSGAYLRLKNLVLGYTFPKKWTTKAYIERLRIYGSAQNLFTARAKDNFYKGFDPEQTGGATCYPINRTFNVGIQLDF